MLLLVVDRHKWIFFGNSVNLYFLVTWHLVVISCFHPLIFMCIFIIHLKKNPGKMRINSKKMHM